MKLNEIKCDSCDKNNKFKSKELSAVNSSLSEELTETPSKSDNQDYEPVYDSSSNDYASKHIVAKCFDCNYYLCSNCLLDHQLNAAFANHQLIALNNTITNDSSLSLKESKLDSKLAKSVPYQQMSNLAQLQMQYNTLEDQLLIKRRQQQQQQQAQQHYLNNQQQLQLMQQNKLIQIENEIQKSYNFYIQMLKERRDYLINELNTIVQYALLSHNQNLNRQLKLKTELEQKRQSLEIAEAVATALSNTNQTDSNESKLLNDSLNGKLRDSNNNKINSGLAEITNLQMLNNQMLLQLKQANPLQSIEFVSNYSAIQTSIRNTFGYIRIRDTNSKDAIQQQPQAASTQASISDYLVAINKKAPSYQQNELKVLTDFDTNSQINMGSVSSGSTNLYSNKLFASSATDYFKSTDSTKSISSCLAQKEQQQQTSFTDAYNYSSPILAQTNGTSNYLTDQFSSSFSKAASTAKNDWPSSSNGLSQLLNSSKLTANKLDTDLSNLVDNTSQLNLSENGEFLFNNNGVFKYSNNKSAWPSSLVSNLIENDATTQQQQQQQQTGDEEQQSKTDVENLIYSSLLLNAAFDQQTHNLQQQQELNHQSPFTNGKDQQSKLMNNKLNSSAITLSASSSKSSSSSSSYSSKTQQNDENLMLLSNQLASPEERSTTSSSPTSDLNYQDSNLDSVNKYSNSNGKNLMIGSASLSSSASSSSSSSSRSQLRRSKMIYHCKFGEFGITDGQFTEPSGVTINTNNDIIVADTNSHRIQIFDKDGRFKFKFGECGKRDGQLLYPNRVSVVKQTGDIVVTERSPTHQIQIYNKYGQFLRKFGANILQHPRGVCVDSKGRIIVVECKVMRVLIFDLMGNVLQKFNCSKYLEFPNGVCCSNTNDREEIYISDNRAHCIKVFDYNGNFVRQIGGEGITNYPIGVGINSNNEILVADNHNNFNLTVFTQDGQLINALESKVKHAQCFDVGLMDDGSIVLASKDYRIYVYKYLNTNYNLSTSLCHAETQLLSGSNEPEPNEHNQVVSATNNENLYDLFSPSLSEMTNYNQLVGHLTSMANLNFNTSFTRSRSSENLIDSFNCII